MCYSRVAPGSADWSVANLVEGKDLSDDCWWAVGCGVPALAALDNWQYGTHRYVVITDISYLLESEWKMKLLHLYECIASSLTYISMDAGESLCNRMQ